MKQNHVNWLLGALAAVAFFFSGAAALTYEILWQRQMILVFGASAPATMGILTALFLGIAVGSRLEEKLQWVKSPVLLLGGIELSIAVWAFFVPVVLGWSDVVYVALTGVLGEESFWLSPLRFTLAILTVLPATLGMGATVPVMVRVANAPGRAYPVAWAYGVNLAGAVLGCLVAGFILIRFLGLSNTRLAGIGFGAVVVVMMLLVHLISKGRYGERLPEKSTSFQISREHKITGLLYFGAGFIALGLEIVWLRMLGILNTSSVTTFTLAVAIYLAGMGIGTLLLYPLLANLGLKGRTLFSLSNIGTAAAALLTFPVAFWAVASNRFFHLRATHGELVLTDVIRIEALISAGLMLLPTVFMGLAFPAVCDTVAPDSPGRRRLIGYWYFLGTLGSAVGILVVALFMLPLFGIQGSLAALVGLGALLFVAVQWQEKPFRKLKLEFVVASIVGMVALSIAHEPRPILRATIALKEEDGWHQYDPPTGRNMGRIIHYAVGPSATVSIKEVTRVDVDGERRAVRQLFVDDQQVASTDVSAKTDAVILAHLPLLLHPEPKRALTVGFGSGGTSYSMTTHGIETHAVEIEPEVPASAHLLEEQNFKVREHPLFRLIINDARDHLRAGTTTYDVISTDVTNLQYKQNGNLYTVEYFQLMKDKLNPGGVACAWIPMTSIDKTDFKTLMASFQEVYPHTTLWFMNNTMTNFGILLGTEERLSIDYERLNDGFQIPAVREDLQRVGVTDPLQMIHFLHLDEDALREYVRGAPLHTDDRPILEFSSILSIFRAIETFRDNFVGTLALSPTDRRPFVRNLPEELEERFKEHQVASRAYSEVLARYYEVHAAVKERDTVALRRLLREGLEWAEIGLAVQINDPLRRYFFQEIMMPWFSQERVRSEPESPEPTSNTP